MGADPARTANRRRLALADRYRDLGYQLLTESARLRGTDIRTLAAETAPVRHLHSSARRQEDALDEALVAL